MKHFIWGCTVFLAAGLFLIPTFLWTLYLLFCGWSILFCLISGGVLALTWYIIYMSMIRDFLRDEDRRK